MSVSLICPCYNSLSSLPRLYASFKAQDYSGEKEIVFVLDPSKDGSEDYLRSIEDSETKVIVNNERLGIPLCRELGVNASRGSLIGFVDADDFLEKDFLSKMVGAMEKEDADACDCSFYVKEEDKEFAYPFRGKGRALDSYQAIEALLNDTSMRGFLWSKLFKKDIFTSKPTISLPKNHFCEDMPLCFCYFHKCRKVVMLEEPLYHYSKERPASMTSRKNPNRAHDHLVSFACIREYCNRYGDEKLLKVFKKTKLRSYLSLSYDLRLSRKDGLSLEESKQIKKEFDSLFKDGPGIDQSASYYEIVSKSLQGND